MLDATRAAPHTLSMVQHRIALILSTCLALLSTACGEWDPRLPGDIRFALPCDMSDEHTQAWLDAGDAWSESFPFTVQFEQCDPSNRNQITVLSEADFLAESVGEDGADWAPMMNTKQIEGTLTHEGHAIGARIDVRERAERDGHGAWYRMLATHELGHALGLVAHDSSPTSIMYWAPEVDAPSSSDLERMRDLYSR